MRTIVRRDTAEDWKTFVKRLAAEQGVEVKDDDDLRRFDKGRKDKGVSNKDWTSKSVAAHRVFGAFVRVSKGSRLIGADRLWRLSAQRRCDFPHQAGGARGSDDVEEQSTQPA